VRGNISRKGHAITIRQAGKHKNALTQSVHSTKSIKKAEAVWEPAPLHVGVILIYFLNHIVNT